MFASTKPFRPSRTLAAALALLLLPAAALAVALTAWTYDPTKHDIYYQFSTDVGIDAWRSDVIHAGAVVAGPTVWDPPGLVTGGAGEHYGLAAGTNYILRFYVRPAPGAGWVWLRSQAFTTDP
jgi:hypothetical protein